MWVVALLLTFAMAEGPKQETPVHKYEGLCTSDIDHSWTEDGTKYLVRVQTVDTSSPSEEFKNLVVYNFLRFTCQVREVPAETTVAFGNMATENKDWWLVCSEVRIPEEACKKAKELEKAKKPYPINEELDKMVSGLRNDKERQEKLQALAAKKKADRERNKAAYQKDMEERQRKDREIFNKDPACWGRYEDLIAKAEHEAQDNHPAGNLTQGRAAYYYNRAMSVRAKCKK